MNLKEILKSWKEYQSWIENEQINKDNIQEKASQFIGKLKEDPEKVEVLKRILKDNKTTNYAKLLNLSEADIEKAKELLKS